MWRLTEDLQGAEQKEHAAANGCSLAAGRLAVWLPEHRVGTLCGAVCMFNRSSHSYKYFMSATGNRSARHDDLCAICHVAAY